MNVGISWRLRGNYRNFIYVESHKYLPSCMVDCQSRALPTPVPILRSPFPCFNIYFFIFLYIHKFSWVKYGIGVKGYFIFIISWNYPLLSKLFSLLSPFPKKYLIIPKYFFICQMQWDGEITVDFHPAQICLHPTQSPQKMYAHFPLTHSNIWGSFSKWLQ